MALLKPEAVEYIAVHCSATQPKAEIDAKAIDRMHRLQGWSKIGYHFVIKRDGTVEKGRELNEVGAHVLNYNTKSVGICLAGGVNDKLKAENNFTDDQFHALAVLLQEMQAKFPKAVIQGHRDFPNVAKDCPCFDVRQWMSETGVFVK